MTVEQADEIILNKEMLVRTPFEVAVASKIIELERRLRKIEEEQTTWETRRQNAAKFDCSDALDHLKTIVGIKE